MQSGMPCIACVTPHVRCVTPHVLPVSHPTCGASVNNKQTLLCFVRLLQPLKHNSSADWDALYCLCHPSCTMCASPHENVLLCFTRELQLCSAPLVRSAMPCAASIAYYTPHGVVHCVESEDPSLSSAPLVRSAMSCTACVSPRTVLPSF